MGAAVHKLRSLLAMDHAAVTAAAVAVTASAGGPGSGAATGPGAASWEDELGDEFMTAVLSFCAHMGGRLDALDNARLYDEFRSFTAPTTQGAALRVA